MKNEAMGNYLIQKQMEWKNFVENNMICKGVRPFIAESWLRCKKYGVDYSKMAPKVLDGREIKNKLEQNRELLDIAHPIMLKIYELVKDSDFIISLYDVDGYIIDFISNKRHLEEAKRNNFYIGSLWTEETVGTNGASLALILDTPVQIIGAEHYCIQQHIATCSVAPIHDSEGSIIGCLNMTGECANANIHTLGIVAAGAYSIENQLALFRSYKLVNDTFDSISEGIIITDENLKIKRFNKTVPHIVKLTKNEIYSVDLKKVFAGTDFVHKVFNVKKPFSYIEYGFNIKNTRIMCNVNVTPMVSNKKVIGAVLVLRESKFINRLANNVAGNKAKYNFDDIITISKKMLDIIDGAKEISSTECTVLIEGDSGTGKELLAHSIHNYSRRCSGPFVAVNCASLPRDLVESELFGYEKGAFTGALLEGNPGKFELANGGTIFLDEIGELPLDIQAKLLRILDNHKITRIGGKYEKELDVRIIAATNRDLYEEVKNKNFREDLYYRINVLKFIIPPLKERLEDIELLVNHFLSRLNEKNKDREKTFEPGFVGLLKNHNWDGNVRELQNIIVRAYYLCRERIISKAYLPESILQKNAALNEDSGPVQSSGIEVMTLEEAEKRILINAIKSNGGDIMAAARVMNMSKSTIYRKIRKYNIKKSSNESNQGNS